MSQPPPGSPPVLVPLSAGENALLGAYQEAMKGAFDAANRAAEFIATVGVAAVTGFGALIGLVQPKTSAAPLVVALPFLFFAVAMAFAVVSRLVAVPITVENDLTNIVRTLKDRIKWKRGLAIAALGVVLVGVVFAGVLIATTYPQPGGAAHSPSTCEGQCGQP